MMRLVAVIMLVLTTGLALARQDVAEWRWTYQHDLPLFWDNIEAGSDWIAGVRPQYNFGSKRHVVQLHPGQWTVVEVPRGQWLRLLAQDGQQSLAGLQLMRSVDGQAYIEELTLADSDETQRLSTQRIDQVSWMRVQNNHASETLAFALFTSRAYEQGIWQAYHSQLLPANDADKVRLGYAGRQSPFWQLGSGRVLQYEVRGPMRIRIQSRLQMHSYQRSPYEPFRIDATLDSRPFAKLELETADERYRPVRQGSCTSPLARAQFAYLDIPPGRHRLELHSDSRQYVELSASRGGHDYLFKTNEPHDRQRQDIQVDSLWDYDASLSALLLEATTPLPLQEPVLQRLIRDNRYLPGALQGLQAASGQTTYRHEDDLRFRTISRLINSRRQWIDLLPESTAGNIQQRVLTVVPLALSGRDTPQLLWRQQLPDLKQTQTQAHFIRLPTQQAITFRLPEDTAQKRLRLYVVNQQGGQGNVATIQIGQQPSRIVKLHKVQARHSVELDANASDLSVALLEAAVPSGLHAYWLELTVPNGVTEMRVRGLENGHWLAARLEQSVAYSPGERDYVDNIEHAGHAAAQAAFFRLLHAVGDSRHDRELMLDDDIGPELINQWLPVLRYLKLQRRYFPASRQGQLVSATTANAEVIRPGSIHSAEQAEQRGDFVLAVESWTQAIHHSRGKQQDDLLLRRAQALLSNGDLYLANREWWNLYLDSDFDDIRQQALRAILNRPELADNAQSAVRVLSAALFERPSKELLAALVPALVKAGETDKALMIGLLIGDEDRITDAMLQAAAGQRWWQVFSRYYNALNNDAAKHYWTGIRHAANGEMEQALSSWHLAGDSGRLATAYVEQLQAIRVGLSDPDHHRRLLALDQWRSLRQAAPLLGSWQPAKQFIESHAGAERLVLPELGLQQALYVATPDQPVQIKVQGPQRLRLRVRPLHPAGSNGALDDWMLIHSNGQQLPVPVINNAIDHARYVIGQDEAGIGVRVMQDIDLGPGIHTIELRLLQHSALVDVQVWQGMLENSWLPALAQPHIQAWFAAGNAERERSVDEVLQSEIIIADQCHEDRREVTIMSLSPRFVFGSDKALARTEYPQQALVDPLLQQLYELLWKIDQHQGPVLMLAQQAQRLIGSQPQRHDLLQYESYLYERIGWQPLMTLERRAGIRYIDLEETRPEHPRARISHALLPVLASHQRRVHGWDDLLLVLERDRKLELKFVFELEATRLFEGMTLQFAIQTDDGRPHVMHVTPHRPRIELTRTMVAGAHSIRFMLVKPFAGQGVRISIYERSTGQGWVAYDPDVTTRSYHVATHAEPLVMHARGPNRIRIDEWRDNMTHTRYRDIAEGWQQLTLVPEAGQQEAMFRLFEQTDQERDRPVPSRVPDTGLPALQVMLPVLADSQKFKSLPVDTIALSGQEDGTWSLSLAPTSRRNLDEDDNGFDDAEVFTDLRLAHRKYVESYGLYHQTEAILRTRVDGGPLLGLRGLLGIDDLWREVQLDASASLYLQHVNDIVNDEWSADLRARLSREYQIGRHLRHKPSLLAFVRSLSLDRLPSQNSMEVDQDIFTRYKSQHLRGLQACEDVTYQPWVDARIVATACAGSNEDMNLFDPDHVQFRIGARALVSDLLLRADLLVTRYFADEDRFTDSTRRRLRLEADWLRWQTAHNAFQVGLRVDHDFSLGENSAWLTLTWHRAHGRFFRDFRPQELSFRSLRQRLHTERLFMSDPEIGQ